MTAHQSTAPTDDISASASSSAAPSSSASISQPHPPTQSADVLLGPPFVNALFHDRPGNLHNAAAASAPGDATCSAAAAPALLFHRQFPHVQQRDSWDCGIACVLMVISGICGRRYSYRHLQQLLDTKSVWTIDLALLLRRFGEFACPPDIFY